MAQMIGLALIGGGAIAERHMQALTQLGGVVPQWIVSLPAAAALDFAARWKFARAGTALKPALADPQVQLVLIASPSPLHAEQAIAAIEAGKDVIVEIPVALSWSDAQRVAQAAAANKRRVWVCHTMRSTAALREVRERVRTGRLHLTHIAGCFGIPRRRNQGMDGIGTRTWIDNLLWHHGCHQIDAAMWVLDMPVVPRVQCLFGPSHPTFGMTLDVGVQMVTAAGVLITQALSYNVEQPTRKLQFIGHEDVLTWDNGRLTDEAGQDLVPATSATDLTVQNGEILRAIHASAATEYDLANILPTMEVLGRARDSAAATRVLPITAPPAV
jgi:2-hydroxy-4-carboxymuconate semialdehyde hemiacetal dehydrogenase